MMTPSKIQTRDNNLDLIEDDRIMDPTGTVNGTALNSPVTSSNMKISLNGLGSQQDVTKSPTDIGASEVDNQSNG